MSKVSTRQLGLAYIYDVLDYNDEQKVYPESREDAEEIKKGIKLEKDEGINYEVSDFESYLLDLEIPAWCDMRVARNADNYFSNNLEVRYHNLMDGLQFLISSFGISSLAALRAANSWYDATKGSNETFKLIDIIKYVKDEKELFKDYPGVKPEDFTESCDIRDYWVDYYNKTRNKAQTKQ